MIGRATPDREDDVDGAAGSAVAALGELAELLAQAACELMYLTARAERGKVLTPVLAALDRHQTVLARVAPTLFDRAAQIRRHHQDDQLALLSGQLTDAHGDVQNLYCDFTGR